MKFQLTSKKIDVFSGWFTNLSAGWFGAIIIFPNLLHFADATELIISLTINLLLGILSLLIALYLKENT